MHRRAPDVVGGAAQGFWALDTSGGPGAEATTTASARRVVRV